MAIDDELQRVLQSGEFSQEDIADVAGALMLFEDQAPEGPRELAILAGLVERADLSASLGAEEIVRRLSAYFAGRATEGLFSRIAQLSREALAVEPRPAADYGALIGGKAIASVLVRGERPAGSVSAGPAARFAVLELFNKR